MTKSTSVQAKAASPKGSKTSWAICAGIQFGEDALTPEEQQLEVTKRAIWKKLMARMQISAPKLQV
jgi:hypothetical protein